MKNKQVLNSIATEELIKELVKREGVNYTCINSIGNKPGHVHCLMVNNSFVNIGNKVLQEYDVAVQERRKKPAMNKHTWSGG